MGLVAARIELGSVTGLPEDDFVNTLNFRWDGITAPSSGHLEELAVLLVELYNDTPPLGGRALAERMSEEASRAADACTIKLYTADELGDLLGSPDLVTTFTLDPQFEGSPPPAAFPAEVSIVASLYASTVDVPEEVGATRPAARRRGRFYWGPLNTSTGSLATGEAGVQRPDVSVCNELGGVLKRLGEDAKNIMEANAGLYLSIYSRLDLELRDVIHWHVDNAFDTQRRRGSAATTRVSGVIDQSQ